MLETIGRLFLVVLLARAPAVHAAVEIWTFDGVTFDDGASANGQFSVDTELKEVTDFDIFTGASVSFTAFQYDATTARVALQSIEFDSGLGYFVELNSLPDVIPGTSRQLHLSFSGPLVPSGSASIVSDGRPGRISYELEFSGERGGPQRFVTGTGQTPVPEPAQVLCLTLGLTIMGAVAMRRRVAKPATQKPLRLALALIVRNVVRRSDRSRYLAPRATDH